MSGTARALADLRREIDEIDQAVHDLLMRRAAVVEEVAVTKAGTATVDVAPQIVYPAREAEVIRRLGARHCGRLPLSTLVQIWREIISASVNMQRQMHVGIVATSPDRIMRTARDHFGTMISTRSFQTAAALLDAITMAPGLVGILPFPDPSEDDQPWWLHLASGADNAPRIVARLPFLRRDGGDALVIGAFDPGISSSDVSLFVIETGGSLNEDATDVRILGRATLGTAPNERALALVEIDGAAATVADERLQMAPGDDREAAEIRYVGGYAVQLAD